MKKRILSFLLALLMVVSIFPAPAYATDSTDVTITPTETPTEAATETLCPTCGIVGCTSEHPNWCTDCHKDDCGQNHCPTCGTIDCIKEHKECDKCGTMDCTADHTNWCAGCKKDDCGVDHNATEPTEAPANEIAVIDDGENTSPYHANIGRKAQFDLTYTQFPIVSDPAGITAGVVFDMDIAVSKDVIPADLIVKIADCYVNEAEDIYWYKIEAAEGYSLPAEFPAPAWVFQDNVSYSGGASLLLLDEEPENPCDCCDSCTGAEGCTCECGDCDFCEKVEDPDVPSISATINGQTVTVSGAALPEGATLTVMEVVSNSDGGFSYDIKVWGANGNEWQPGSGESVKVMIPVSGVEDGCTIDIVHILENEQLILDAVSKGNVLDGDGVETILSAAARAYENAIGEGGAVAYEAILGLVVENSCVSFDAVSFSIYTWNGSYTSSRAGADQKIVMRKNAATDGADGNTYYVTNKHSIYMDRGGYTPTGQSWTTSNSSIGSFSGNNTDKYFNLNGTASLGTTFTITYSVKTDWSGAKSSTITIVIIEERTVTFNANGGSCSTTSAMAITDGGSHKQNITLPKPTRTGYTFLGWYTAASGGTRKGGAGTSYMPDSNGETLYAQWEPIKYTVQFNANGGTNTVTGSMPTLNMTYDVETTLPRNQFINQGDGMVFLGWATSPTGDVVHKDGAKIKNLTATNNDTVTLYAKWKYGLASTVYIGINNTYHNPKGTYTAGGVTINSYHTYPNEPAQMTGDFDRVTDTSGGWTYNSESAVPLKNQAASYINGNIFNSPDYEMTYVEGENTLGIADPTGSAVRSMLKFTEADYNAMIAVWLEGMRNTLISYGDTSFDWQNAKASDFTIVPYVIKFQNYDSWYIDMVVVPKALYTLAYDGNIENGYTASFTGVAFPPSSQYTDGSTVNVIATPIGYNGNNMKVTKVVDGHTYTAVFQYWYDANGNTYGGNTGRNTIKLTADTILYAKWEYPDASFGNLNITKTVVDKDVYENPASGQNFTFKFTTSASGSYYYTIYDQSANVKNSGTIANNGTFTLQDGWRIRITDLPKNASYSVTENAVSYYTKVSGSVSGTINAGATTYATVTNEYQKNADYTVKHFLQNADKNGYTELGDSAEKLHGVIGTDTVAAAKNYNGYTPHAVVQKKIQADGKTVIEIYYDLIAEAAIKWNAGEGQFIDGTKEKQTSHEYGAIPTPPEQPSKESTAEFTYTFDKWTPTIVEVTGDTTYTATYSQTKNKYNVTGIIDNDGEVTNTPQSVEYGEANLAMVFTPAQGYEISGVSVNGEPVATFDPSSYSFCQTITKDTTVEVTTSCVVYTITYDMQGGVLDTQKTNPKNYTVETETFTLNNPTKPGYKFLGWATSENATTGMESITIAKGTTGNKTYYAVWERSLVDLTIKATTTDTEQSLIFTVSGTRSDGVPFDPIDVVLCSENNFQVTIKELPVGEYTVTEKDDWSWRENAVDPQKKDLTNQSQTATYDFKDVNNLHWLSGYSYKRKKGGS